MRPVSIRMRLTLWYSGMLGITFVLLGAGLFYELRKGLYDEIDQGLTARIGSMESFLQSTRPDRWAAELNEEYEEQSASRPAGELMQIRRKQGEWIYQSPSIRRLKTPVVESAERERFASIVIDGRPLRTATTQIQADGQMYSLLLAADTQQSDATITRFGWLLFAAIPVALALASGGGYWMSRRALSPVNAITESARSISASNLSKRLHEPATGDELQRLTGTLNEMFGRLEASFQKISQFTADASHELRTPVTVIRTAAELSLRQPLSESEYRETLGQILEESERTTSLIEGLMILARGDSGSEVFISDHVNLSSIVAGVVRQARTLAQPRQIEIRSEIPEPTVEIVGDAEKLSRMFLILADNAVKYTPPGGTVNIRIEVGQGSAAVVVQDSGIGISQDDLPKVFERFYRADKSRSREVGGFGLGLAIAKWIADAHQATITVESDLDHGSVFRVTLPKA